MMSRKVAASWLLRVSALLLSLIYALPALAQHVAEPSGTGGAAHHGGGEANLVVPNLADPSIAKFLSGMPGASLLYVGLLVSALGMGFGFLIYTQLRSLPVHKSMLEISELIYET